MHDDEPIGIGCCKLVNSWLRYKSDSDIDSLELSSLVQPMYQLVVYSWEFCFNCWVNE